VLSLEAVRVRRFVPIAVGTWSAYAARCTIDCNRASGPRCAPPAFMLDAARHFRLHGRVHAAIPHFLHAMTDARKRVHSFLFGTRRTNVTRALKAKDLDEALAACSASAPDWSGGHPDRNQSSGEMNMRLLIFAAIAIVVGAIAAFGDWSTLIHPEKQEQFVESQRHSFERLKQRIGDILPGK
jgi:hypothetical protein